MNTSVKLKLFDTGYCLNFEKMAAVNKPWKLTEFYATAALIEHPFFGPILFDTGYSDHVVRACQRFPFNIYKLLTPLREIKNASEKIEKYGYLPNQINHIILSHFHIDHIGGVKDFPDATFHYLLSSYENVKRTDGLSALKKAFIPELLPDDFERRSKIISKKIPIPFAPFNEGYDLFEDGSVIGVELPGHAKGQLGVILQLENEKVFLVADACWQSSNYQKLEYPHLFGRLAIDNYQEFCQTLQHLHNFHQNFPEIRIIPSHCQSVWQKECQC